MKWAHLPNAGGLYDQHPDLIDDFYTIMSVEMKAEHARMDEAERKQNRLSGNQGGNSRMRRGRRR